MFNRTIFIAIGIIALIFVFAWADNGGLEAFNAEVTNTVGEVTGANNIADAIRNANK